MKISVFGMGYVGAVTSACFAKLGLRVIGVDIDQAILDRINSGRAPIVEKDLDGIIQAGLESGLLSTTTSAREAVAATDISIVCVGTPSSSDGKPDLTAAKAVVRDIAIAIREKKSPHTVVLRSTILPGTTEDVLIPVLEEYSGKRLGQGLDVCFNPEFLREGVAVDDFFTPPFIVIGGNTGSGLSAVEQIYAGIKSPVFRTNFKLAESVKYLCNAFQAMKIAFANEAGSLLREFGVDGRDAMKICCEDRILNISPAYLRPGYAFGGSCLPKDLRALMSLAASRNVDLPLIGNILPSNNSHIARAFELVRATGKKRVALFGIAFKPGTNDLRESGLLFLAGKLLDGGSNVAVFDANVDVGQLTGDNRRQALGVVPNLAALMSASPTAALVDAEVIVVGNANAAETAEIVANYRGQPIIDLHGIAELKALAGSGYRSICW